MASPPSIASLGITLTAAPFAPGAWCKEICHPPQATPGQYRLQGDTECPEQRRQRNTVHYKRPWTAFNARYSGSTTFAVLSVGLALNCCLGWHVNRLPGVTIPPGVTGDE